METNETNEIARGGAIDDLAEAWFAQPDSAARLRLEQALRASSRPPPPPPIDDEVADSWFR